MTGNTKQKDNAGRVIFENANLCSQFLKEYSGMEIFKEVEPEDIEDMTERFLPMISEERQSDVIKKVKLRDKGELYVVALIEHKSSVDYNVVMQMFHYMSYIWEEYERSMEKEKKGIIKTRNFKYPPIIPIVYYEDTATWNSAVNLKDRVFLSDILTEYIPDYRYMLFKLQEHGNAELINKQDGISLIMLINKLRNITEFRKLNFPATYFDNMTEWMPGDVLIVLSKLIESYLREINLPDEEIYDFTDQIKEGNMARFFENFEKFDIQEHARVNREKGEVIRLIKLVYKKLQKGKSVEVIADEVEESTDTVKEIISAIEAVSAEPFDAEKVYELKVRRTVAEDVEEAELQDEAAAAVAGGFPRM